MARNRTTWTREQAAAHSAAAALRAARVHSAKAAARHKATAALLTGNPATTSSNPAPVTILAREVARELSRALPAPAQPAPGRGGRGRGAGRGPAPAPVLEYADSAPSAPAPAPVQPRCPEWADD